MNKLLLFLILFIFPLSSNAELIIDEIATDLKEKEVQTYTKYDFESTTKIPVKIKITTPINSEADMYEGEQVEFVVSENVKDDSNKILIPKGLKLTATAKIIITSGMNGIPASIIFTDFKASDIKKGQFSESYEVFGQDRSLFVFPLKWALTPFPPTGSFTNLIKGGHAKLSSKKTIVIYYYPEWL